MDEYASYINCLPEEERSMKENELQQKVVRALKRKLSLYAKMRKQEIDEKEGQQ